MTAFTTTRMRWHPVRQPDLPASPSPRLRGARIAVFGGTPTLVAAVVTALVAAGARAQEGLGGDQEPDGLVDLTMAASAEDYRGPLQDTLTAIRSCYPRWVEQHEAGRVFYLAVTYLGGTMGYTDAPIAQPFGGIWAGLAKTLHRELPACETRIVDVAPADVDALPDIIVRELYRWGLFEIGYRDGRRYSLLAKAEPVRAPRVSLDKRDIVLVSGGGRGIGFLLARSLAEDPGCRVVVTGRQEPPTGAEPLDSAAVREFEAGVWARRTPGQPLPEIRAELAKARRGRELADNLAAAHRDGLPLEYVRCDFTDPAQVAAVVARCGDRLAGVVHNAGIDSPARLPAKSDADALATVSTKVDGFTALFDAVRALPLKFFCGVGSLTGRLGGMVGQLDYAAANDGLARLGFWAGHQVDFPVTTVCWPTWDQVGMITNFAATLRYMAPLAVAEGVQRWRAELFAGTSGEVGFVGPLGRALGPVQAIGYPAAEDLPGFAEVYPRIFHLGAVTHHRPGVSMEALVEFDLAHAPVLGEFSVSGVDSIPVSVLLENAAWSADWVSPVDRDLQLGRIDGVVVQLAGLRLDGGAITLCRSISGRYVADEWVADISYRCGESDVLTARLVYAEIPTDEADATAETEVPGGVELRWRGLVLPLADATGVTRESHPGDLWAVPHAPRTRLPLGALESVLRDAARSTGAAPVLSIGRIVFTQSGRPSGLVHRIEGRDPWIISDGTTGDPLARVSGLVWSADDKTRSSR